MDDKRFVELVKALRNERIYRDQAIEEIKILGEKLNELHEYQAYLKAIESKKNYESKVIELEKQLRKELEDDQNYETPFKAAWKVSSTIITLDEIKALEWAKKYMPVAIIETLDEKPIKDWIKKNPEYGKEIAKIEEKKIAKIAKNLTVFDLGG